MVCLASPCKFLAPVLTGSILKKNIAKNAPASAVKNCGIENIATRFDIFSGGRFIKRGIILDTENHSITNFINAAKIKPDIRSKLLLGFTALNIRTNVVFASIIAGNRNGCCAIPKINASIGEVRAIVTARTDLNRNADTASMKLTKTAMKGLLPVIEPRYWNISKIASKTDV